MVAFGIFPDIGRWVCLSGSIYKACIRGWCLWGLVGRRWWCWLCVHRLLAILGGGCSRRVFVQGIGQAQGVKEPGGEISRVENVSFLSPVYLLTSFLPLAP